MRASIAPGQDATPTGPDFSETRLREGKEDYSAKRDLDASNQLRIAAFGFLDRPALLCESLVYLALADEALGRSADAKAAVARLAEIERTFPACSQAALGPEVRAKFESQFHQRAPGSAPPATSEPSPPTRGQSPAPTPRPGGS